MLKYEREIRNCMIQILVLAATPQEIAPFDASIKSVDVLITGIGIPATIYQLQKKLITKKYNFVIQAGVGGAFLKTDNLGETFIIGREFFGDLGIDEKRNFTTFFDAGFQDRNQFPFTNGGLDNNNEILSLIKLPKVNAVTVNKVSDSFLQKMQMISAFNPKIESMEGAAMHFVCLHEKIAFLQLRSISNYVGERDKEKWDLKLAINNLNKELLEIVSLIKK